MVAFHLYIVSALSVFTTLKVTAMEVPVGKMFENTACAGKPLFLAFFPGENCTDYSLDQCESTDGSHSVSVSCATGYRDFTDTVFGNSPYLLVEQHSEGTSCGSLEAAVVYPLDGQCHELSDGEYGLQATLNSDNSVSVVLATDSTCAQLDSANSQTFTAAQINTDVCIEGSMRLYTNAQSGSTITTGTSSGTSALFIAPIAVILAMAQTLVAL